MAKEIVTENDALSLQEDLNKIQEWSKMWGMNFNTTKCFIMTVTNKRQPIINTYHMNNMLPVQCLIRKDEIKYLGVHIDNRLSFRKHIQEKCRSANKILNMLRRNIYFAPRVVKAKAYQSCVRPILEYAHRHRLQKN